MRLGRFIIMSKKRSYSTLEALLRQNQQRIRDLERQLAESKKQLEAAKRSARAAKSEVKKLKSEVIKPQEVKVSTNNIKVSTKEFKPIDITETKSADLSALPRDVKKRIHASRIYIPQFIDRLREYTNLSEMQLWQIENKLRVLKPDSIDEILDYFEIASMYYGSGQDWIMTETELKEADLYESIMAYQD